MKRTVSLIIENLEGEIILQLRDNNSRIPFPNHWATIGGAIEHNETPEEALMREVKEELDFDIKKFQFFKRYQLKEIEYNIYYIIGNYKIEDFDLREGQAIRFFSSGEIPNLNIAFSLREIILDYFKHHSKAE